MAVPELEAFMQAQQHGQRQQMGQLAQAQGLMGILSAVQQQQQRQQALAREQQMRGVLSQLPPDATQDSVAAAVRPYASADDLLKAATSSADRKAALEAAQENRRAQMEQARALQTERLEQAKTLAEQRSQDMRLSAQERNQARMDMMRMAAALRPAPQPQMATTDQGVFQIDRSGQATPVVGPDGKPLTGKNMEKALPTSAAQKLFENQQNLSRAEQAVALMEGKNVGEMKGDVDATGWKGFLPDAWLQRMDPKGVDARAALADLGSLVIHDRSGAAVTAMEFPRLQPFIPSIKDDPETVKKKLRRFAQVYRQITDDTKGFYKQSGYKVPDTLTTGTENATPAAAPASAPAATGALSAQEQQELDALRKRFGR